MGRDERGTICADDDDKPVIDVGPAESENSTPNGAMTTAGRMYHARTALPRFDRPAMQTRMSVEHNDDGSVTLTPEPGAQLVVTGNPDSAEVEVLEVQPAQPLERPSE